MGLRINTNVASLTAQRTLAMNNDLQAKSISKLSTGERIVRASDDAAGLAISEKLKAKIRGLKQATRNTNDGISMIQTAEGGLSEISNILTRLRELTVQAASDTLGNQERSLSDLEFQNLKLEIERIAQVTEFNGKKLLNGKGEIFDLQVGMNNDPKLDRIQYDSGKANATIDGLDIGGLSVMSKNGAQEGLNVLDQVIANVSGQRANLGAIQNRLNSAVTNLQIFAENLSVANSRIRDTDFATEVSNNTRLNILLNAGTSVLAQANATGRQALKLIGG